MSRPALLLLALTACGTAGDATDEGVDTDVVDTQVGSACTVLKDGTWDASGTCFGMRMSTTLTFDAASCTFTLTDWDMEMETPNPTGGSVDGDAVSLDGEPWATSCTATASAPNRFTGTCEEGCAFQFARQR
jgi:hypothetical protein